MEQPQSTSPKTSSKKSVVILCSTFPFEVGAACVFAALIPNAVIVSMSRQTADSPDATLMKIMEQCPQGPRAIIAIGSYWSDECFRMLLNNLASLEEKFPIVCVHPSTRQVIKSTTLLLLASGDAMSCALNEDYDSDSSQNEKVLIFSPKADKTAGPAKFMFILAKSNYIPLANSLESKWFFEKFAPVIQMIDDRLAGRNNVEVNVLHAGLQNFGPRQSIQEKRLSIQDRFLRLFKREWDVKSVMDHGRTIVDAQYRMVEDRVSFNSKIFSTWYSYPHTPSRVSGDFIQIVMTEASELTEMTHEVLHATHPNIPVTLVVSLKFEKECQMSVSFRSHQPDQIWASDLIAMFAPLAGGGSASSAGGRINCPQIYGFIPSCN